jgi:hypothetical protein
VGWCFWFQTLNDAASFELCAWVLDALRELLPTDSEAICEGSGRVLVSVNHGGAVMSGTKFMLAFDQGALNALRVVDAHQRLAMAGRLKSAVAVALLRGLEYEARVGRALCIDVNAPLLSA